MSLRTRLQRILGLKQHPVSQYILMSLGKDGIWTPENYANLSEAGYKNCAVVFACINQITKNAAGIEWAIEDAQGQEIKNHPFLSLINRPNDLQGKRAFLTEMLGHLLLTGNAYVFQAEGRGLPQFLYNLRPDRMSVLPGTRRGELIRGYRYEIDGSKEDFDIRQVKHIKLFNPINDFYGLGPVSAAARAIDIANYADAWNAALIRNDMKPAGAFVAEGYLGEQQFARLKNQVEEMYQGYDNAGRPLVLDGSMKFQPFSMSPKDLDWLNSNKANMRNICAAFGWPSQLVGDTEASTYANYQEARKAGYIETIMPLMDFVTDEFQSWLLPLYGSGLRLVLRRDKIDALQENENEKYTRLQNCAFLTINEKREAVGKDAIGPDGDVVLVPFGLMPLEQAVEEPEPIPQPLQDAQDNGQDEPQGDNEGEDEESSEDEKKGAPVGRNSSYWAVPERKEILWKTFEMRVRTRERSFEYLAKQYLEKQAADIKRKLGKEPLLAGVSAENLLNVEDEAKKYTKHFWPWYRDHFRRAMEAGIRASKGDLLNDAELKADEPTSWVSYMNDELEAELRDLVFNSGTQVNKSAIEKIFQELKRANAENLTVDQFAAEIYDKLKDFTPWKARLWARTESARVDNFGLVKGYKQTEFVEKKGWMCSFVPDSREEHMMADGQVVLLDEDFNVGGESIKYPGDGSPGNACNCLCSTYPIVPKI